MAAASKNAPLVSCMRPCAPHQHAATQLTTTTTRSQWSMFVIDGSKGSHRQWKGQSMATVAMVVFVEGGPRQRRQRWDGGTMMQWHCQQWCLRPMVAVAMVVVVVNCAAAVGAAATIPSSALTLAAKTPSLPLLWTATSIEDDCYPCQQWPPSPLPHSQWWTAVVVLVSGNSSGEGRAVGSWLQRCVMSEGMCFKGCISRCAVKSSSVWKATHPFTTGLPPGVMLNGIFYYTSSLWTFTFIDHVLSHNQIYGEGGSILMSWCCRELLILMMMHVVMLVYCRVGVLSCWCIVVLVYCHVGVLSCWCILMLVYCCICVLSCLCIAVLVYCCVGVLLCWFIVMLVYCCVGVLSYWCIVVMVYCCVGVFHSRNRNEAKWGDAGLHLI